MNEEEELSAPPVLSREEENETGEEEEERINERQTDNQVRRSRRILDAQQRQLELLDQIEESLQEHDAAVLEEREAYYDPLQIPAQQQFEPENPDSSREEEIGELLERTTSSNQGRELDVDEETESVTERAQQQQEHESASSRS